MLDKLSIVIPAAGCAQRLRSQAPAKCLINLSDRETILSRQLHLLHKRFPLAEISVILGHEIQKISKILPNYVNVVYNRFYEHTNVGYSISLGLKESQSTNDVLIVYGDLVFNKNFFQFDLPNESFAIVDKSRQFHELEVGVTTFHQKDYISCFSYGLPIKWSQIVFLKNDLVKIYQKYYNQFDVNGPKAKTFGFEALNYILEDSTNQLLAMPTAGKIVEVDQVRDVSKAQELCALEVCK